MIVVVAAAVAQAVAAPTALAIFQRAQAAWLARTVPPYESFEIACDRTFLAPRCDAGTIVRFTVRTNDGRTFAQALSTGGEADTVLLQGGYITGPAETPLGFYRAIGSGTVAPSPPPNLAPDPLQTIATVTSTARVYDVTLAGEEELDGRRSYHLALRPRYDPVRFPLRELWVDESSYQIVQLTYERPYNGTHARVWYRFAAVGPERVWTIVHIEAEAVQHEFLGAKTDRVADTLGNVTFPADAPSWWFEPPGPA